MIQKKTITDIALMLKTENDDMGKEYVCNGMLKDFEVKTAVNGKPYVHMVFADDNNEISVQYFYKQLVFDPNNLVKHTSYNLHGVIKKSSKGISFFTLTEKPEKNVCGVEESQDDVSDNLFLPILSEDISNIESELDYYPIFADEMDWEKHEVQSRPKNKIVIISSIPKFSVWLTEELIDKLKKEDIEVSAPIESIDEFFKLAIDSDEVEIGNFDRGSEYVKQIVMNLQFQLMLSGSPENKNIGVLHIRELAKELFGKDLFGASTQKITPNVTNESTTDISIDMHGIVNENQSSELNANGSIENRDSQDTEDYEERDDAGEELDDDDDSDDVISPDELQRFKYLNDTPSLNGAGYDSLYEALKGSGEGVPQRKITNGEKEEYVDDIESIKKIEERLPTSEKILYACDFMHVGLLNENQFKKKSNGFFDVKHKHRDLDFLMIVITESMLICTDRYAFRGEIRIDKTDVESIKGIFVKSGLLSFKHSQIQVRTKTGKYFVINKFFVDKRRYDEFLTGFKAVMNK